MIYPRDFRTIVKTSLDIDPRKYGQLWSLEQMDNHIRDGMTQDSWKSIELKSALIVGFWVSKSESDDQGILELWDTSSKENGQLREYVKKNYNQGNEYKYVDIDL